MLHRNTDKLADTVGMKFAEELTKQALQMAKEQRIGDTSKYDLQVMSSQGSIDQGNNPIDNNSMIQLIEKLDGTSIQLDSEINSGAKRISPRALISQPFVQSRPEFENGVPAINSSLNSYTKKSDRKAGFHGTQYTSVKKPNSKHNESLFSVKEPNEDLLSSLKQPNPLDDFEPIHPHNFSHIQDGQRAYDEALEEGQRYGSAMGMGATSQSIMHRASPLSNAKLLSRGD